MANPFYIEPANPLQALMIGGQAYDQSLKRTQEQALRDAVTAAGPDIAAGNYQAAIAKLGGAGGLQGLMSMAQLQHQAATEKQAAAQLAESIQHNRATEALAREGLQKPVSVAPGNELVIGGGPRQGERIYGDSSAVKLDPDTIDAMARQAMSGDTSVFTNLGRGAQGAENVIAVRKRIAELNRQSGETGPEQAIRNAEFFGTKAGQRTLGTRSANIELAATEFNQVLPVVQKASQAVSRTNYPDLNKIIQMFQEKTGDPNVVAFGGAVNTLVNLYARAINPTGTPTVSDKDHARGILQRAWSQGQFDAAVGMMKQEIDAALNSPEKVREQQRARFLRGVPGSTQPQEPTAAPQAGQVLQDAKDAIARGAPRDAVIQRLRQMGVEPGDL